MPNQSGSHGVLTGDAPPIKARTDPKSGHRGCQIGRLKQPFNFAVYWCCVSPNATGVGQVSHGGRAAGSDIKAVPVG
jgi:hypothetical protein